MKELSKKSFEEIQLWMYRNARPLELAIWQYEFENGSKEKVLAALSKYQNKDGGFGNALEPDCWNPNSSPYSTLNAIDKLKNIGYSDIEHPIIQGILKFLESGLHSNESGWFFSIPANNDYPHAPWWNYDPDANEYESVGVSAGIACFILKYADKNSNIYEKATAIIDKLIDRLSKTGKNGDMGVGGYCELMDTLPKLSLSNRFDLTYLSDKVRKLVYDSIEKDVSKWSSYGKTPSSFIFTPESLYYKDNEELLLKELDYIIENRPENGVWGITWSWFENNEIYPKEFAIAENWWKADIAIGKLKILRSFGRLEGVLQ